MSATKITKADIYRTFFFAGSLFAVGFLWKRPLILLVILTAIFLEVNRTLRWKLFKTGLLCSVLGPVAEIAAISLGAWTYTNSQIFGISLWLAPLWGISSLFFIALARILDERI